MSSSWRLSLLYVPLLLVASVNLLPEVLPKLIGGRASAWAYVAYGAESAILWAFVFVIIWHLHLSAVYTTIPLVSVAWASIEGAERAVCRSMLPMDKPLNLGGQPICDAVFGWPVSWASIAAAVAVVWLAIGALEKSRE